MKSIRNVMKINMTSRICISSLISLTVQLCFSFHGKTAAWLAQLVGRQSAVREVEGSSPRPDQHSGS